MPKTKILIADDYYLIREGIKNSLLKLEDVEMVGETNDYDSIMPLVKKFQPHILIIELNLCQNPLIDLIKEIKQKSDKTKVLVLSDCDCELPVITSIRAGISGFLKKNVDQEELIKAISDIASGKDYFTSEVTRILMKGLLEEGNSGILSEREVEVLKYICKGRSNEQIGDILFISEKTIATHKRNIMKKAGVKKTSELILWALENKMMN